MALFGFGPPNIEKLKAKRDVAGLIKALDYQKDGGSKEAEIHSAAALALGDVGDAQAVVPLITALRKGNEDTIWALGKIGDARAIAPLVDKLSACAWLRDVVTEALIRIGDAEAVGPLVQILKNPRQPKEHCTAAGSVLATLGTPAVDPLTSALLSENLAGREHAARALGLIGDASAVGRLLETLADDTSAGRASAEALDRLGWQPDQSSTAANYWIAKREWSQCVEIGAPAVSPLIRTIQVNVWRSTVESAAETLGKIGGPATEALFEAVNDSNLSGWKRAFIAQALGEIGDLQAIDPLTRALKDSDQERELHQAVTEALKKLGGSPAPS